VIGWRLAYTPTTRSTSPRDPNVDNNTRISQLPFPQVLASASDSAASAGSCRKPPGALYVESEGENALPLGLSQQLFGQLPVIELSRHSIECF
jgi:hypothetical protein